MIISVEEAKKYMAVTLEDSVLEAKLQALESLVREYTNNNFQKRGFRYFCPVMSQKLYLTSPILKVGDTVQVSNSVFNNGVYTIAETDADFITLNEALIDESLVTVTKVVYPKDVQIGVVNMLNWDLANRDKVGIQSETISRHSVTYFNMDGDNSTMGYPKSLLGFLKPYMCARF